MGIAITTTDLSSITLNVASCRLEATSIRRRLMLLNYTDLSFLTKLLPYQTFSGKKENNQIIK